MSYKEGMRTLIDALHRELHRHTLRFGTEVERIEKRDGKWWIQDQGYDFLVLASSSAPEIFSKYGNEIRNKISAIRKNSAIVIVLAFKNLHREGFGWLVPASERKFALACTYINNKFANRCPPDHLLLRVFVAGSHAEKWLEKSDDELIGRALIDLKRIAQIDASPVLSKVYRWPAAMPEYAVGHQKKIAALRSLAKLEGSLFVANNLIRGVGIPDCLVGAALVAAQLSGGHKGRPFD